MGESTTAAQYTSIIAMLVESFTLESIWTIGASINGAFMIGYQGFKVDFLTGEEFFANTGPFIEIIAYLLILYRVSTGQAWQVDTEEKLTSLQWNRDGMETTQLSTQASVRNLEEEV
ncbi:hypothetical protein NP233_g12854 [Leucocoprinus birnbaumii]|uniref:Uncharacterized protein n=1 Tax=Leucocoprinus birnbaumii TaxID=56174 RepID=A0AAD5YJ48_9AGAR|nr:hypothetical protein NP233_g12854 [Leucocoprinus birnbaumii]